MRENQEKYLSDEERLFCRTFEKFFVRLGLKGWSLESTEKQNNQTNVQFIDGQISLYSTTKDPSFEFVMTGRTGSHTLMIVARLNKTDQKQRAYIDGRQIASLPICKGYNLLAEEIQWYLDNHPDIEDQFAA